ncbi:DEAD/DEAH box helicase [Algoriphagus aquimarinus]|uniref:DEAD-box ATP-dependent RNA helicase RhpA n=1 Tax=Algoriphagus aquimarinus TaxID=237018 RepID=A0A1I1CLJ1_9BACT|nr:DEAD/DEAH box helicase [Algoriphagus aquimarinus]SFB61283.1 ATP-dependent RNA helicase RhlE [Algoriphagus aquimarinus]|tara:strand:+ start:73409 stop:74662 length:1254 start_codon:yes stop_codon:yes gene_type:complete
MSFKDLGLSDPLLRAVAKKGYSEPSPIQIKAIPLILKGRDVLASAQTGTGKTAGFTLPILQLLAKNPSRNNRPVRALVLTPTRELAAQIHENVVSYGKYLDIRSTVIFGGVNQNPQVSTLRRGVDILIATPGRLLDLINQRLLSLSQVEILVLDEADRMLDMGFINDIKKILLLVPDKRQNLLFSATFSSDIKNLANRFLDNPVLVEATPENTTVEKIIQKAYKVDQLKKADMIIDLIAGGKWQQVLVFTRTKHGANKLTEKMNKADVTAAAIHGNKSQGARTKALAGFKDGKVRVLVATDIAARGLDIPLLPHVINFELPNIPEDYVHRIGRTGRAGASGEAISLVAADEIDYLRAIEKLIDQRIPTDIMEGFEPVDKPTGVKPASKQNNQRNQQRKPSTPRNGGNRQNRGRKPNR